ncbi:acyltransferase family protein [Microbacterium sp. XT11]|uniref:acyltransferase family protein n=1 Tax=Microbacterium sp. XT11 TaxID=367477 RepID=UPI0007430B4B|nr:acyltransferase [Microbacterium sp. XT11]ALX67062.1 hypothetical protein AB663_002706 [Microbacterium sp. XT11]
MATIAQAPVIAVPRTATATTRDTGIDFVRALCILGVVLLHSLMVGVTLTPNGPVFDNASTGTWWIVPVSWTLQVMPLFFIIGGFSGLTAYRRQRGRGEPASVFVAGRVHRLLRPAVVAVALAGIALLSLAAAGVSPELIAVAGFRYGQPLWFLAVFLLCQALLPALAAAHERAPRLTLALLAGAALSVDGVRIATGAEAVGFLNLAFVWLTLKQLGFFFADGSIDALGRKVRAVTGVGAIALLVATTAAGVYSPDLIASINPPTGALLLVGMAHLSALSLFRDRLRAISRAPLAASFSRFVNGRAMTIYLWHMPVLLAMAGVSALAALTAGVHLSTPSSLGWWIGRPLWLGAALAFAALTALLFTRAETAPAPAAATAPGRLLGAVLLGVASVGLLLVVGTSPITAAVSVGGLLCALALARDPGSDRRRIRIAPPALRR